MLSKDQSESLLYNLSSIFRDFLPVDNTLLKLYDIYATTIDYVWNVYGEAGDSRFISTTRTLSTIPYFKLNVDDALYDLATARLIANLGIEDQIAYLDKQNLYSSFVFTQKDASGDPTVYSMRLLVNFSDEQPLKMFQDYFIRSNRLYLLPSFIQSRKQVFHYLHAFDIKINDHTLEKNFGTQFDIETGPLLSRFEYRDVLEAFIRSFQGNLSIKALKDSIQLATKWEQFNLEDYKSPLLSSRKKQLYDNFILSPNRFLVSLPESLIPDKVKVNIVRTLLNEIKESQTDYMVFFDIERDDIYPLPMKTIPKIGYSREEAWPTVDQFTLANYTLKAMDNPFDVFSRYDNIYYYDNQNMEYDDPPGNEIVGFTQSLDYMNTATGDEGVTVTQYTLIIPRHFVATQDSANDTLMFSCDPNQDTTTEFELEAALSINGPYESIEMVPNNSQATTISFTHNAIGSGNLYYKSRSKDPSRASLFTLPIYVGDYIQIPLFDDSGVVDDSYLLDDTYQFDSTDGDETVVSYLFNLTVNYSI